MTERQYVQFPVPVEYTAAVTMFLADLERGLQPAPEAYGAGGAGDDLDPLTPMDPTTGSNATVRRKAGIVWTPDEYDAFFDNATLSKERIYSFFAKLPIGEENAQPTSEIVANIGNIKDTEIRAALSWLTKFLRNNPDTYASDSWPFGWKVGKQVDPNNPYEFHYWLSQDQANAYKAGLVRWLERRGGSEA